MVIIIVILHKKEAAEQYAEVWQINEAMFVHGRGHRKTTQQTKLFSAC